VSPARRIVDPELLAQASRDLVALAGRLVRERSFEALSDVFSAAADETSLPVSLANLEAATRAVERTLAGLPSAQDPRTALGDEARVWRLVAAETLLARTSHPPVGTTERSVLERAAGLFARAGSHRRAALTYQEIGDDVRAAEAWGAMGDLDQMEAAHARDERRIATRRNSVDAVRRFETLMAAGDRRAALALVGGLLTGEDATAIRETAARVAARLVRGRAVTMRARGGAWLRFASLPAVLGRDPSAELSMRDPGVSRRHAILRAVDGGISIEDAGSRGGLRLGGARIESPIVLAGEGELALGPSSVLRFTAGARAVTFEGEKGLDRSLRALVGGEPLALDLALPELAGLELSWPDDGARLSWSSDVVARVNGQLVGPSLDLLHGETVELTGAAMAAGGIRLEVE